MLEEVAEQIEKAANDGDYVLALFGALTLPSICGALESADGVDSKEKYKGWYDTWMRPSYQGFLDGEQCYYFRCAMLHQGRSAHNSLGYSRVLFIDPGAASRIVIHKGILGDALVLDVRTFCKDMVNAVRTWLSSTSKSKHYVNNVAQGFQRFPAGFPPYIVGVPVITSGGAPNANVPQRAIRAQKLQPSQPPRFALYAGFTDEDLSTASRLSADGRAQSWIDATIKTFSEPYFDIWSKIKKEGTILYEDPDSRKKLRLFVGDLDFARMVTFSLHEKPPAWLREFRFDVSLVIPMERAFQVTALIDKKLGRPTRWQTVNEMVTKVVQSKLGTIDDV